MPCGGRDNSALAEICVRHLQPSRQKYLEKRGHLFLGGSLSCSAEWIKSVQKFLNSLDDRAITTQAWDRIMDNRGEKKTRGCGDSSAPLRIMSLSR